MSLKFRALRVTLLAECRLVTHPAGPALSPHRQTAPMEDSLQGRQPPLMTLSLITHSLCRRMAVF